MWDDFLTAGLLMPDMGLEITREAFDALNAKHFGNAAPGTLLHTALKPVVVVVKAAVGIDLSQCGGCAERQLKLNALLINPA